MRNSATMRHVGWLLMGLLVLPSPSARAGMPASLDEFRERLATEGNSPVDALHLWFEALFVFNVDDDERRQLGSDMLDLVCADEDWHRNELFLSQLRRKPYIFRSYAVDAEPENDYMMDPENFSLRVDRVRHDDETHCTIDLRSSGADRVRPVPMIYRDGHWWVDNIGNLYAGVEEPQH